MIIRRKISNQEVLDLVEHYEFKKAGLTGGVDKEDVIALIEQICDDYERSSKAAEPTPVVDTSNMVPIGDYNAAKARIAALEEEIKNHKDESNMVMEILMDSKKKAANVIAEAQKKGEEIVTFARKEAGKIETDASENSKLIIQDANQKRSQLISEAEATKQQIEDSRAGIIAEAHEQGENFIKNATEKAEAIIEEQKKNLHEAELEKAAVIEKANQKAEEIVANSRYRKEQYEQLSREMQEKIDAKKLEYADYIKGVEASFDKLKSGLVDFKKDLDIMFPMKKND